jgi:hypothetical protein
MRRSLVLAVLIALASSRVLAQAPPAAPADKPVRVAYYYKVRWGFQDEFERLFFKNHYPVLMAQQKEGTRIKAVSVYHPVFHGDGRQDWTFLVVITFANWSALPSPPGSEKALAQKLYPDQDTFTKEERRRFEIVDAHWDVPLAEVEPQR